MVPFRDTPRRSVGRGSGLRAVMVFQAIQPGFHWFNCQGFDEAV